MRWSSVPKIEYGTMRTVRRFLFLPVKPAFETELRWLEWASYTQKFIGEPSWFLSWLPKWSLPYNWVDE